MTMTEAKLLEGKVLAAAAQTQIKDLVAGLSTRNLPVPKLVAIQVGDDSSSDWYVNQQEKLAGKLGLLFERIRVKTQVELESALALLNGKEKNNHHGIFITMPLPKGFQTDKVLSMLDPKKDVEGIHPNSLGLIVLRNSKLIPCTAYAAFELIKSTGIELKGKRAVIVGQSAIVGRPLQMLLGENRVTTIVCNSGTSSADLQKFVSEADIVVGCAGQPGLIKGAWIKPGAVVIDVGTTEVEGKLVGDVEFEEAKKRASFITPVPGGVGPLTATMLMQNLVTAYFWQHGK